GRVVRSGVVPADRAGGAGRGDARRRAEDAVPRCRATLDAVLGYFTAKCTSFPTFAGPMRTTDGTSARAMPAQLRPNSQMPSSGIANLKTAAPGSGAESACAPVRPPGP